MLVRRINVADPIRRSRDTVDRLFDTMLSSFSDATRPEMRIYPPLNIWQDDVAIHVEAELPGFAMDKIDVTVQESQLTISGTRSHDLPERATLLRQERQVGEFSRTVTLPVEIDAEKVEAKLEHGVLTVTLPKAASTQPRRIEVRAGQ